VKKGYPVSKAIKASRLWDRYWIADKTLTNKEMEELASLSTYLRKTFLRRNRRRQSVGVILNFNSYFFSAPKLKIKPSIPKILPY